MRAEIPRKELISLL